MSISFDACLVGLFVLWSKKGAAKKQKLKPYTSNLKPETLPKPSTLEVKTFLAEKGFGFIDCVTSIEGHRRVSRVHKGILKVDLLE